MSGVAAHDPHLHSSVFIFRRLVFHYEDLQKAAIPLQGSWASAGLVLATL